MSTRKNWGIGAASAALFGVWAWLVYGAATGPTELSTVVFKNLNTRSFMVDLTAPPDQIVSVKGRSASTPGDSLWFTNLFVTNINGVAYSPITINPSNGYVPYRLNATTFADSPWYRIGATKMGFGSTVSFLLSDAAFNIGLGESTMIGVGVGSANTAIGYHSQWLMSGASGNTSLGANSLAGLLTGYNNTVVGRSAGSVMTGGGNNTLMGNQAGQLFKTGDENTFIGNAANLIQLSGGFNATLGSAALYGLVAGDDNTAVGAYSGGSMTNGQGNVFIGRNAANGWDFHTVDPNFTNNIVIGRKAQTWTNGPSINQIVIGTEAVGMENNTIVIGNSNHTRIFMPSPVIPTHTPGSSAETNYAGAITWDGVNLYIWTSSTENKKIPLTAY